MPGWCLAGRSCAVAAMLFILLLLLLLQSFWPVLLIGEGHVQHLSRAQNNMNNNQNVLAPVSNPLTGQLSAENGTLTQLQILQRTKELQQSLQDLQKQKQQQQQEQQHQSPSQTKRLPHILFILADDLGHSDFGAIEPSIITPVLNSLVDNGVYLRNYYSQSLCSPSRAALHTGRYPARFDMQSYVLLDEQAYGMGLQERTLPQYLKVRRKK